MKPIKTILTAAFLLGSSFAVAGGTVPSPHNYVDIKPQSCPNPINVKQRGVVPVAILGTAEFDVTEIDLGSIQLVGVVPLRWDLEDVATPYNGPHYYPSSAYSCTLAGPDGYIDLTLKFDAQELVLALGGVSDGNVLDLQLTGNLHDGTPVFGMDVIIILKK